MKPYITSHNQWGQRIDDLYTSEGWRTLKAISTSEGAVGIFYERERRGEFARVYGFAKIMMGTGDFRMVWNLALGLCPIDSY